MGEVERKQHFFHDTGGRWSWMTSGPIGYEYAIQAERSVLLAALGLEPDSIDEIVTASLRAQAESDPAGWCDEHGISYSLWEKWPWYTFEPGFRGSDD